MISIHQIITYALMDFVVCISFPVFYSSVLPMRYGRKKYLMIFPAVMYLIINPIIYLLKCPQLLQFSLAVILMLIGVFVFSNGKPLEKIFFTLIPYAINIISSVIYLFLRSLFMPDFKLVFGYGDYIDLIFYTLGAVVPLFFISRLIRHKKPKISDLIIIYIITTILIQIIAMTFILYLYTASLDRIIFMIAFVIYMIASLVINIFVVQYIFRINCAQLRRELIENQYDLLCSQYDELRNNYVVYKKLRHDLKDHIQVIDGLSHSGNTSDLTEYTGKLLNSWDSLSSKTFCDVPAVDIVLANKYSIAVSENIRTDFTVTGVSCANADNVYMCSIFANLLNNAIEAAVQSDEAPFIELKSGIIMGNFIITCRNSMPQKKINKKDPEQHGYGLHIISELTKLLNGSFIYENDDNTYTATVTLPSKNQSDVHP